MALRLEQKREVVAEVARLAGEAHSAIAAEYSGLSVADMTALRREARHQGVQVRVVKNTLARRAFEGTDLQCLNEVLQGPLLLVFSTEDPGSGARIVKDFAKKNNKLVTKAISFGGTLMPASDLDRLASLPTLEEARAMLLGTLAAPATKLVRTLNEPAAGLVRVLAARRDQQQAA